MNGFKRREEVTDFVDISMSRPSLSSASVYRFMLSVSTWLEARRIPATPYKLNLFTCNSSVRYLHFISGSTVPLNSNMHRTCCNETSNIKNGERNKYKTEVLHGNISYVTYLLNFFNGICNTKVISRLLYTRNCG